MGLWSCKGYCTVNNLLNTEKPDNWRAPFASHSRCRKCEVWIRHGVFYKDNRCPCCHGKLAMKPRLNQNKKRYRIEKTTC